MDQNVISNNVQFFLPVSWRVIVDSITDCSIDSRITYGVTYFYRRSLLDIDSNTLPRPESEYLVRM